ncbi:MAG: YbfB/YjiJ family MFS transporter, partial [Candidatus Aenigmatarchaeota archaeon]
WRMSWIYLGIAVIFIGMFSWLFLKNHPSEIGLKPIGGNPTEGEKLSNVRFADLITNRSIWHLAILYFTFGFSYIIYATFFAAYIIKEKHIHESLAGNLWSLIGILSIISGFMWGGVSDIIGRKYTFALISFFQGLSYLIFILNMGVASFYISAIIFGLTAWSIPAVMSAACGDYCGAKMAPAALGFVTFIFGIGQMISPSIAGYITDILGSFNPAFLLACIIAWTGAIISLTLKKPYIRF